LGKAEEEEGVPRRFENPVEVPTAVFDGLETVQESRETSMLDHQAVQDIADRLGYPETALWVRKNRQAYLEGVSRGFVVAE
jgi:adenylate cyclase class IV